MRAGAEAGAEAGVEAGAETGAEAGQKQAYLRPCRALQQKVGMQY